MEGNQQQVLTRSRVKVRVGLAVFVALLAGNLAGELAQAQPNMHGRMMGSLPAKMDSPENPATAAKVNLGRMLFYDARLSLANDVSCNSCHDLARYGVDGLRVSKGHKGQTGNRNSPTVYHAAGHLAQFWDGRAGTVEDQAKGPVMNPVEMAMPGEKELVAKLSAIAGYRKAFAEAFPGEKNPVSFDNMAKAIGAFERGLVTPSRWDRFLAGEAKAITDGEKLGHHEFMHNGCATCHNGAFVGGKMFQKLGQQRPWPNQEDVGRYEVTKQETDRLVFKVPSLRNVEKTGPYFHNGRIADLDEAVRLMGNHQLGVQLNDAQVTLIVSWLKTLTGEIPQDYIRKPKLP